jgi:hypothetical protein
MVKYPVDLEYREGDNCILATIAVLIRPNKTMIPKAKALIRLSISQHALYTWPTSIPTLDLEVEIPYGKIEYVWCFTLDHTESLIFLLVHVMQ